MKLYKPLWAEGALLLPQQFQQQAQWIETFVTTTASMTSPNPWGVTSLAWDLAALSIGKARLQHLAVRLPDGTWIDGSRGEPLPPARDLSEVPADIQAVALLIGVPLLDPTGNNCDAQGAAVARARRFVATYEAVPDLLGDGTAEIAVERLNARLIFDFEPHADFVCCPIGRLVRDARGEFRPDEHWIPPCLTLAASPPLMDLVERLSEIILARSEQLSARRAQRNQNLADYSVSDISLFWLLNCINAAWPRLHHLRRHPAQHPEHLWLALAQLAGSLTTFALDASLSRIPMYDHTQLQRTFGDLETLVRTLLDTVVPSPVVPIQLERVRPTLWRAHLNDERLVENADFFLSVHASLPGHRLQEQLPLVCKVGSPEEIERILNSAVVGVPLKALQRVPSAVPLRLENQYFALDEKSPAFESMLQARACSIYVPASIPEAVIEFFAVLRT